MVKIYTRFTEDQNGSKTVQFGGTYTFKAYVGE